MTADPRPECAEPGCIYPKAHAGAHDTTPPMTDPDPRWAPCLYMRADGYCGHAEVHSFHATNPEAGCEPQANPPNDWCHPYQPPPDPDPRSAHVHRPSKHYDPSKGILPGDCWDCGFPTPPAGELPTFEQEWEALRKRYPVEVGQAERLAALDAQRTPSGATPPAGGLGALLGDIGSALVAGGGSSENRINRAMLLLDKARAEVARPASVVES